MNGRAVALSRCPRPDDSSTDYDPSPHFGEINAPLFAINFADDKVNPPELGILERK